MFAIEILLYFLIYMIKEFVFDQLKDKYVLIIFFIYLFRIITEITKKHFVEKKLLKVKQMLL